MSTRTLPTITIVTPSYNQGDYLAETIESVLEQAYPKLEYFILDGGSTDASCDIIRQYERHLSYWHSRPDRGQADAIRTGFEMGTGEILAWLNSDDHYEAGALHLAAEAFMADSNKVLLYGDYFVQDSEGCKILKPKVSFDFAICLYAYSMIPQPAAFWTRAAYEAVGGLDDRLQYCMDYDLFLRLGHANPGRIRHVPVPLATFRVHDASKSVAARQSFEAEQRAVRSRFVPPDGARFRAQRAVQYLRLEYRFVRERRMLPLRKDRSKA